VQQAATVAVTRIVAVLTTVLVERATQLEIRMVETVLPGLVQVVVAAEAELALQVMGVTHRQLPVVLAAHLLVEVVRMAQQL
jgi:hypothetical protein